MHDILRLLGFFERNTAALADSRSGCFLDKVRDQPEPPMVDADPPLDGSWRDKLDELWQSCIADRSHGPVPPADPAFVRPRNLLNAFVHRGDTFPRGHSMVVAQKYLHPIGCVARVAYRPDPGNRCRGILAAPSEGLLRVSNGNISDQGGFAAGVGLKFPRTDRGSADMVFGPPSFDIEDTDETIVTREQRTWLGPTTFDPRYRDIRTLFWIFDRIREEGAPRGPVEGIRPCSMAFAGRAVNVEPLYDVDQDGVSHASEDTRDEVPIGLVMVPSEHFVGEWKRIRGRRFTRVLPKVAAGPLYRVYALWHREEPRVPIGSIELVEPFTTSVFGDTKLFFRHPPKCPSAELAPLHVDPVEPRGA
ncbi:MAG: hypothetical protein AAF602_30790 [Myxococcota bacterium]